MSFIYLFLTILTFMSQIRCYAVVIDKIQDCILMKCPQVSNVQHFKKKKIIIIFSVF